MTIFARLVPFFVAELLSLYQEMVMLLVHQAKPTVRIKTHIICTCANSSDRDFYTYRKWTGR